MGQRDGEKGENPISHLSFARAYDHGYEVEIDSNLVVVGVKQVDKYPHDQYQSSH